MSNRTIPASEFKAKCLAILDQVSATGEEIIVTKHGRPVAHVSAARAPKSLHGSVTFNVSDDELTEPLDLEWDAATA
jgi:prevent-host-death family protein